MMQRKAFLVAAALVLTALDAAPLLAGQQATRGLAASETNAGTVTPPSGYVIGPQDLLNIRFWKDPDMSPGDVVVRPDGKISMPLLNDIQAAGLTPEQLRVSIIEAASGPQGLQDPNPVVTVKAINSRTVYITGMVAKPSAYPLNGDMDVLQLISIAGGLLEYAESSKIMIVRTQNGKVSYLPFNWKDVLKQRNVQQNIQLIPGDRIVVP